MNGVAAAPPARARLPRRAIATLGAVSRQAQRRGVLGHTGAAAVKRVAAKVAGTGEFSYRDRNGYLVEADLSDYMERAGFFGAHANRVVRVVRSVLKPGDWAIDAGANVGLISSEMCAAVGRSGAVWAVEPLPRNVARLEAFKAANGLDQLAVFPCALAAADSTALLQIPITGGASGWGSLLHPWETAGEVRVPTWRLDDLVAGDLPAAPAPPVPPSGPLRLVKIDVEGSEPDLLAGAERTLADHRPLVVCEFNDFLLRHAGTSSEALLDSFARLGYRPQAPLERPGRLERRTVDILLAPTG